MVVTIERWGAALGRLCWILNYALFYPHCFGFCFPCTLLMIEIDIHIVCVLFHLWFAALSTELNNEMLTHKYSI